jgi:Tfp pilus assembly protein PilV
MHNGKNNSNQGMTLIETCVALFVFSACIAGACAVIVKTRELEDTARARYTAVNLAKNRIEQARCFAFVDLDSLAENNTVVGVKGLPDTGGDYRRSTVISLVNPLLKAVIVTVEIRNRYTTKFQGSKETVSTYLADYIKAPTP